MVYRSDMVREDEDLRAKAVGRNARAGFKSASRVAVVARETCIVVKLVCVRTLLNESTNLPVDVVLGYIGNRKIQVLQ
jgi:hypothetical protein